jgi:hypothetical protein
VAAVTIASTYTGDYCSNASGVAGTTQNLIDFESSLTSIKTNMTAIDSLISIASCNYSNAVSLSNLHTVMTTDANKKHDAIQDITFP